MELVARPSIVRVEGGDIHWYERGVGRPIVLLHGLNDSHRTWAPVAEHLARDRRVLMPDLMGHGLSSRPDASYALAWHAAAIGQWLDALGLDDVDLVGHSYGGGVAQYLLLSHRARIRRLALVSSGGLGREVALGLRMAALGRVVERFGQPFMSVGTRLGMYAAGGCFTPEDIAWLSWANARPGTARGFARTVQDVIDWRGQRRHFLDRAQELGDLPPTALFWGDRDRVIPIAHGRAMSAQLEGVGLTTFAGCGHFPHRERAPQFVAALTDFAECAAPPPARVRSFVTVPVKLERPGFWSRMWRAVVRGVARGLGDAPPRRA